MEKKLKIIFLLLLVPSLVNTGISVHLYFSPATSYQVAGYALGTVLSIVISYLWPWQVRKVMNSRPITMLKTLGFGFLLKVVIVAGALYGGYYALLFDIRYFAVAFLFGLLFAVAVEVWLFRSIMKKITSQSEEN